MSTKIALDHMETEFVNYLIDDIIAAKNMVLIEKYGESE